MPKDQIAATETPIRVIIGNSILTGRLWNNPTARDLIAQLPLTLAFRDFNRVEKIAQLPRKLSMDGVPAGDDPFPHDIGYYNPSGDLVFYYDDVGAMAKGIPLCRIGRPEEIASAVLWLCSEGTSFVVGHALVVDGGGTVG